MHLRPMLESVMNQKQMDEEEGGQLLEGLRVTDNIVKYFAANGDAIRRALHGG